MSTSLPMGERRPTGLRNRLRRWLGVEDHEHLLAGQREDFGQMARALHERDVDVDGRLQRLEREQAQTSPVLRTVVEQLNRTSQGFADVHRRLTTYESSVPAIAQVKRAVDAKAQREAARIRRAS